MLWIIFIKLQSATATKLKVTHATNAELTQSSHKPNAEFTDIIVCHTELCTSCK